MFAFTCWNDFGGLSICCISDLNICTTVTDLEVNERVK